MPFRFRFYSYRADLLTFGPQILPLKIHLRQEVLGSYS
jgi:hypothetical protein